MGISTETNRLFKILQTAITSKLRSVTHTDAIRQWEQELRLYALQQLGQRAEADDAVAQALNAIERVDQKDGVKLVVLLDRFSVLIGSLQQESCLYPLRLMQAIMVKPVNVRTALEHIQSCDLQDFDNRQRCCVIAVEAELLSALGETQEAYALLKKLKGLNIETPDLRFSCNLRLARLARTRNTKESHAILLETMIGLEKTEPRSSTWVREYAECTHELGFLLFLCGQHTQAIHWERKSLACWQQLTELEPDRIDVQLLKATSLRTLAQIHEDIGEIELNHEYLKQSTEILVGLRSRYPGNDVLESELPKNHDAIGDMYLSSLEVEKALHEYTASAAIAAHLQFRDPLNIRWKVEEIKSSMRIAQVMKKMGKTHDALELLAAYRPKLEALTRQDPDNLEHRALLLQFHLQAGDLHWLRQDYSQAGENFSEALAQINYAIQNDTHYPRWLLLHLMALQRLADLQLTLGQLDQAFTILEKARSIVSTAESHGIHSMKIQQFAIAINTQLSNLAFTNGKNAAGKDILMATLEQVATFQQKNTDSIAWATLLYKVQMQAARQLLKTGSSSEIAKLLESAINGLLEKRALHPGNIDIADDLVRAQLIKVEWLCQQGNLTDAYDLSLQTLTTIRTPQRMFDTEQARIALLCECLEHFAFCCHHLSRNDQEFNVLKMLRQFRGELLKAHPESVALKVQYFNILTALGKNATKTDLHIQALSYFNEALKGYNELYLQKPNHPNYLMVIGELLVNIGYAYQHLNRPEASSLTLSKALEVVEQLETIGSDSYAIELAATEMIVRISQSQTYQANKADLLRSARAHAMRLQESAQNPVVDQLVRDIEGLHAELCEE